LAISKLARFHAPLLGEHSREVLRDLGGVSEQELDELQAQGVIHVGEGKEIDPSKGKARAAKLNDLLSG
jgi:hypothetical protein